MAHLPPDRARTVRRHCAECRRDTRHVLPEHLPPCVGWCGDQVAEARCLECFTHMWTVVAPDEVETVTVRYYLPGWGRGETEEVPF